MTWLQKEFGQESVPNSTFVGFDIVRDGNYTYRIMKHSQDRSQAETQKRNPEPHYDQIRLLGVDPAGCGPPGKGVDRIYGGDNIYLFRRCTEP